MCSSMDETQHNGQEPQALHPSRLVQALQLTSGQITPHLSSQGSAEANWFSFPTQLRISRAECLPLLKHHFDTQGLLGPSI